MKNSTVATISKESATKIKNENLAKIANFVNNAKNRIPKVAYGVFRFFFIVCMAYVLLYPILVMLSRSIRPASDMLNPSIVWIPSGFTLTNIKEAWDMMNYGPTALYTMRVVVIGTLLSLVSCSMAGYALARYKLKITSICAAIAIFTIVVPMQTYMIPLFMQFKQFGLNNTEWSYYLPAVFGAGLRSGLFVIVFMQFFKGLPRALEDASRVDGCSEFRTYLQVMLPNSGPVFLVVSLFSIVWYWNDYYFAQIMMQRGTVLATMVSNLRRMVNGVNQALGGATDQYSEMVVVYSGALLFILPPLILYLFVQKYFIQSIERTGIVG